MIWLQGWEQIWSSAIVLWWRIYKPSGGLRGNRKRGRREADSQQKIDRSTQKGETYISTGELQSTVSVTPLLTFKTRVCHWLSASWAPRNTQCSTTPPWPLKRKCRCFLENLSPRMIRPWSSLFLPCLASSLSCFSPLVLLLICKTSPLSFSVVVFSAVFGSIREKMYSFLCVTDRKNVHAHCIWQENNEIYSTKHNFKYLYLDVQRVVDWNDILRWGVGLLIKCFENFLIRNTFRFLYKLWDQSKMKIAWLCGSPICSYRYRLQIVSLKNLFKRNL